MDSAVAALLALEAGHEVVAVTLELWSDPAGDGERSCCSPQTVSHARALAHRMGLAHLTLDLRDSFRREVVADFVAELRAGRTPNPCVRCNGLVRFEEMLGLAERLGAGRLATGHYARLGGDDDDRPLLRAAADPVKDQAYMLSRLEPDALRRLWFPLGELAKPRVRELAAEAGLAVARRPDSQDLCFLAGTGRDAFLARHAGSSGADPENPRRPGEIVSLDGTVLARHDGHERFTVGQRRGLGVAGPDPLFVIRKDARENRVWVGPRAALSAGRVLLRDAVLHRDGPVVDGVKLRYRAEPVPCRVEGERRRGTHEALSLVLERPVEGIAPGQTACLLDGDRVVGAAVIAEQEAEPALRGGGHGD